MTKPRILSVDDEPHILQAVQVTLRKYFDVTVATSGPEALAIIDDAIAAGDAQPFEAIVSDMRMPTMNGAAFLTGARVRLPNVPRLLLSGQSDLESAIEAINEAKIFRFLTKPCPPELLIETLDDAVEQARLRNVEEELLDRTLRGTIAMLNDVLGLVNVPAYSRSKRLLDLVRGCCTALGRGVDWELNLAATLSQIGCVVVPEADDDVGSVRFDSRFADAGAELIGRIPRLEAAAVMIAGQVDPLPRRGDSEIDGWNPIELDAEILRVCALYERLTAAGVTEHEARDRLRRMPNPPADALVDALARTHASEEAMVHLDARVIDLAAGMILHADVALADGRKLAVAGTPLTTALVARIAAFAERAGVIEPIRVLAPSSLVPAGLRG